ncbi:Na(+)/H(+) exchange regulatory cofactor NHE-RF1 isoform X2 [Pleuronectes platessa]|uniref:Na(+)/H(+) exchange regulatory cofactor NHE-RF1 isoform X2 n=1 Tax=Pleuronectes platessa TaxID=8262 RepID=UPI00232A0818|nr:Na(+)/H(+) exchange regulatory cofactor NHE-RF1 isoform X2 [Pleuronectes platessa]
MRQSKSQCLRPRLCALEKGDNGYGFHLHGEKGKTGQFIRLVESDSPAETSGLRAGDRLVFVNGEDVETESHQQVVSRIRATPGRLELVVVDPDTEQLLKRHNMKCLKEYVTEGVPVQLDEEEEEEEVEEVRVEVDGTVGEEKREKAEEEEVVVMVEEQQQQQQQEEEEEEEEVTPRESTRTNGDIHEHIEKKLSINSEKVNGMMVEGKTHSQVVAAIKAGGNETRLLLVDADTDAYFKRCRVAPTVDHLTGPLPEPVINGGMEEKVNGRRPNGAERDSKLSISPSPSSASSNTSLTTLPANTPPEGLVSGAIPALNLSLQQVKELAHQKRANKKAPPMDWTKKNELFSNL